MALSLHSWSLRQLSSEHLVLISHFIWLPQVNETRFEREGKNTLSLHHGWWQMSPLYRTHAAHHTMASTHRGFQCKHRGLELKGRQEGPLEYKLTNNLVVGIHLFTSLLIGGGGGIGCEKGFQFLRTKDKEPHLLSQAQSRVPPYQQQSLQTWWDVNRKGSHEGQAVSSPPGLTSTLVSHLGTPASAQNRHWQQTAWVLVLLLPLPTVWLFCASVSSPLKELQYLPHGTGRQWDELWHYHNILAFISWVEQTQEANWKWAGAMQSCFYFCNCSY